MGRPLTTFVTEGLIDRAARRLGRDAAELRLQNSIRAQDFPYKTPSGIVWDRASLVECLEKALQIAGHMMENNPSALDIQDRQVFIKDKADRRLPFQEVARAAYGGLRRLPTDMEPGLEVTRFYDPYFGTASNATHVAVVEVG